MSINIGPIIKEAIEMKNMTQKEAAKLLHISPQVLSMYINNRRTPDLECVISMINVFEMDLKMLARLADILSLKSKDLLLTYGISKLSDLEKEFLFILITTAEIRKTLQTLIRKC